MDYQTNLKIKQHELVHGMKGKRKTVYEIADHVCKSYNYLCRISSLTEDIPFPSELEVQIMKLQNNYDILQLKAWECGFAIVKLPKVKLSKKDENEMINEFHKTTGEAISALAGVLGEMSDETYNHFANKFMQLVEEALSIKKTVNKKANTQIDLFEN